MASDPPPSESLRVRLSWPEEEHVTRRRANEAALRPEVEDDDGAGDAREEPLFPEPDRVADSTSYSPPPAPSTDDDLGAADAYPETRPVYAQPPRPALPEFPRWPASEPAPSFAELATVPVDDDQAPEDEGSVLFTVSARLEGMRAAMGTMALRLDSMQRRDEEFREFTSNRLAEYAEQLALGVGAAAAEVEDRTRSQERTMHELVSGNQGNARAIEQLANAVNAMAQKVADLAGAEGGLGPSLDKLRASTARVRDDMAALAEQVMAENELVRAEVVAATARVDEQHEELATELATVLATVNESLTLLSDEVRALRRRMTVRATPADTASAKRPVRRTRPE